jgi:hypothetical protein
MIETLSRRIRTLFLILNVKTAAVIGLAVLSTWVCRRFNIAADFPVAVVLTAVVFPIVFSINAAYQRRETALAEYANIKGHGQALYLAARDWLAQRSEASLEELHGLLGHLLSAMGELLASSQSELRSREQRVYRTFSELSLFIKNGLRGQGLSSGDVSRCNEYLSKMLVSFETLKQIHQYRTPISLRAFSDFFLVTLPILYGPYFAFVGQSQSTLLAYMPPVLFSLILVTLDNIQEHL